MSQKWQEQARKATFKRSGVTQITEDYWIHRYEKIFTPPILLLTIIHNFISRKGEGQEEYLHDKRFEEAVVLIWDAIFQIAVPFFREVVKTVPRLTLSKTQKQLSNNLLMLTFIFKGWRNPQLNQITIASCLLQKQEAPDKDKSCTMEG